MVVFHVQINVGFPTECLYMNKCLRYVGVHDGEGQPGKIAQHEKVPHCMRPAIGNKGAQVTFWSQEHRHTFLRMSTLCASCML